MAAALGILAHHSRGWLRSVWSRSSGYWVTPSGLVIPYLPPAITTVIYWTSRHSATFTTNSVFLCPQDDASYTRASRLLPLFSASDNYHTLLVTFTPLGHMLDIAVIQKHFASKVLNFKILLSALELLSLQPVLDVIWPLCKCLSRDVIYFPSSWILS